LDKYRRINMAIVNKKSNENSKFVVTSQKTKIFDIKNLAKQFKKTEDDTKQDYNPFSMKIFQKYNPIYSSFFDIQDGDENNVSLNQMYEFVDMNTVLEINSETEVNKPVFIKFSPLLDPLRYMIGKYDINDEKIRTLPTLSGIVFPKLENKNNASYVDCFFNYLSSQLLNHHGFLNSVDFYGSYLAVQDKYKMNIADDIEYLYGSPFFISNIGKLFSITEKNELLLNNYGSRTNKNKLNIKSEKITISVDNLDSISNEVCSEKKIEETSNNGGNHELVYEKNLSEKSKGSNKSSSTNTSNNSETNYSTDEDEGDGGDDEDENDDEDSDEDEDEDENDEDEEESEEEKEISCYINNFPVQMICQEKCNGTIDNLFEKGKLDSIEGASALFQIIMILIVYQKAFHFTHNDLHTNNIMYINTEIEFLYYELNGKKYKIPTYGRIYKIIDFGRGIYKFNGNIFCSDSFSSGGDAYTQYNFEPFFNKNKPRLEPNYSFDLCRLGCSIYDFIIDDDEEFDEMDEFQKTIHRWCLDDNGKNVLYKKNGDERYPGFKLYKMIARTVHNHLPQSQLEYPFFSKFLITDKEWKKIDKKEQLLLVCIDKIPCYANNSL